MSAEPNLTDQDYELLSDYLDGELTNAERMTLEARLAADANLRRELAYFRQTVALISQLPELQAPRDFTLDAKMVGQREVSRPVMRPRFNLSLLTAAAALVIVVFGAAVVLNLAGPQVGNIFSDIVSGLDGSGVSGSAPSANQVAQAPTPTPSITSQLEKATDVVESPDDISADSNTNAPQPVPSPTIVTADGLMADAVQETTDERDDTSVLTATQKAASESAPAIPLEPTQTLLAGFAAGGAGGDVGDGDVTLTQPAAEMQLFSESPGEPETASTIGRTSETVIPPGTAGETSIAAPSIAMTIPLTPTEAASTGALAAAQPTVTTNEEEAENAQRGRRGSVDLVSIIVVGTVVVSVGVFVFLLQRQTP